MSPPCETFTTYCMNTMEGRLYSGIPSLDVAISMAIDFERYQDDEDDEDDALERVEVTVDMTAGEGGSLPPFIHVYGGHSREVGVHAENRCAACRRSGEWGGA
jgi:hypothetical protein